MTIRLARVLYYRVLASMSHSEGREVKLMARYAEGTVLTCTHEDCSCRVLIQAECHCPGAAAGTAYRCACGAEMVPAEDNQG